MCSEVERLDRFGSALLQGVKTRRRRISTKLNKTKNSFICLIFNVSIFEYRFLIILRDFICQNIRCICIFLFRYILYIFSMYVWLNKRYVWVFSQRNPIHSFNEMKFVLLISLLLTTLYNFSISV